MSEEDILFRVKLNELQEKLTQKITKSATKISEEDVKEYYDKNKKRFAQPERRDLRIVLTKTEAKANEAKAALESGQDFKTVAKQYSIDEASKAQGGKLPAVAKGQQEKSLDEAVFTAKKGTLEGPVKTQFGWYVFEVNKITPASQQSLAGGHGDDQEPAPLAAPAEGPRRLHQGLPRGLPRGHTCADDYEVAECRNGPDETDTGAASGGAPQGQGQAQQPQPTPTPHAAAPEPALGGALTAEEGGLPAALVRLDEITRLLRRECPWDREQDERSIVPHTVEEAYELADAAQSGDDEKMLDELGDVLFQVVFLSLLLEERGKGDLAAVADHCRAEADPPAPARVRRARGRDGGRRGSQLEPDQARRGAGRRPVRPPARDAARDDLREEGAEAQRGARAAAARGRRRVASCSPRCGTRWRRARTRS